MEVNSTVLQFWLRHTWLGKQGQAVSPACNSSVFWGIP